jgi:predicted nucleotidyltransferase
MATIMSFDIEAAARRMNEENRKENARVVARRKAARAESRRLAAELRAKDSTIIRIWGFGSTFEDSRPFRMDSDIDIAIEGGDIIKLVLITESSVFKVDLIDIGDVEDGFAESVRQRGTVL